MRMKAWKNVLVVAAVAALSVGAFAQGAGPGAKRQGEGPRMQQGQRGRFVQALEKLDLTDKQKQQIQKARDQWTKAMEDARKEQDREKRRTMMREAAKTFREQLDKILTAEQKKKLEAELRQMRSNRPGGPGGPGLGPRQGGGNAKEGAGKAGGKQKQK
jgi:Spy/CpxP family protein refolding chaperone